MFFVSDKTFMIVQYFVQKNSIFRSSYQTFHTRILYDSTTVSYYLFLRSVVQLFFSSSNLIEGVLDISKLSIPSSLILKKNDIF